MSDREAIQIEMQIRYEELCEKVDQPHLNCLRMLINVGKV